MKRRNKSPFFFTALLAVGFLFRIGSPEVAQNINHESSQTVSQQTRLEIPRGWTIFRGQGGLIVPHPVGWKVQERGEGGFVATCPGPDGKIMEVIYVQPIAKIEGRAAGVVQGLGQIAPELFPGVQVMRMRAVSSEPEVAIGEISFTLRAMKFIGVAMCFKQGLQGVAYAIASTSSAWTQSEAVMKQVLSRFFYSGRGEQPGGAGRLAMAMWKDPAEGAFTCSVPQAWKIEGGLKRFSLGDVRPEILATSPDDRILVRIGDSFIPMMILPTQLGMQYGQYEGGWRDGILNTKLLIMRYLPSTMFLNQIYLPQRVGPVSNVQARDLPEISRQRMAQTAGLNLRIDTGEITFDAQTEKGIRKGYGFIQTQLMAGAAGLWVVNMFAGYLAEPKSEPLAQMVMNLMVANYRKDPNWEAQQTQAMLRAQNIARQVQQETSNIINQVFADRSRSQDRINENWSRAYRGEVLIQDPTTGEKFEVPTGSDYYFRVGSNNQFVGANTATHPDSPNHWLTEMHITN
jgi:hypothetical protein